MSMAKMLGKMVVAGLVAKGVGKMMGGNSSGGGVAGALAGMLGGSGGSAGGALGSLLGGAGAAGGLGGLLNSLGGSQQQSGGIGDILGSLMGGEQEAAAVAPTDTQNQQAEVLIRAMINAARCDGEIDQAEQQRIVEHLGDISQEEAQFLREEMSRPFDAESFIRSVPRGMEQQVYLMSLTAIDLDAKAEAQYLHQLAQGLGISQEMSNHIHAQVGAPQLYS